MVQEALQAAAPHLPIIFLTGHGTIPMCVRAMKAGAVDFLQKPVDDEDLLAAISVALAQDNRTRHRQCQRAVLRQRVATLTRRQRDVMGLVTSGLLNKEIAYALGTSEKTIKVHRARVMQKMQATSVAELVRMAVMVEMGEPPTAQPQPISYVG
jgi:FixJ family two-component response regulator